MDAQPVYTADEFARESQRIDTLVWDALCIQPDERVLFCGYAGEGAWVRRSAQAGAQVSVIEHREEIIRAFADLPAALLRGSTSVIPAKENAFDLAVAFHYLHECDPFFHAQIVSELARVAKRVAIVEPSPPADPLGKRIVALYARAKRELGQFEYYQQMEYWKKLLRAVKADVAQHVFAFAKVAPHEYVDDTVRLLLDTMRAEDAPADLLEELRAIARKPESRLLPPARYVLLGAAVGDLPEPVFAPPITAAAAPTRPAPAAPATPAAAAPVRAVTPENGYEFPPVDDDEPVPPFSPGLPFGAPPPPDVRPGLPGSPPKPSPAPPAPFGEPFALPNIEPAGWSWEPPEVE